MPQLLDYSDPPCHGGAMSFTALDFDDLRWTSLHGGYRVPYDPRPALQRLERGETTQTWQELWNELYHQGDVGKASYAAVPHLVRIYAAQELADWSTFALVATIEEARLDRRNPNLPPYLKTAYEAAWKRLVDIAIDQLGAALEPPLVSSIIGVIAFGKGPPALGQLAISYTEDERQELLE